MRAEGRVHGKNMSSIKEDWKKTKKSFSFVVILPKMRIGPAALQMVKG